VERERERGEKRVWLRKKREERDWEWIGKVIERKSSEA
jgi:hypothetical protein